MRQQLPLVITRAIALFLTLPFLHGCSSFAAGRMEVEEVYYLAVPSGENANFYRVTVQAKTRLGDAQYRSGWFPADAVDQLYGTGLSKDSPEEAKALITEGKIKGAYNKAIKEATENYIKAASDPKSSDDTLANLLAVQRRVRSIAGDGVALPPGAIEIEYDPAANVAVRHAGQKLVFLLHSNPDEVIGAIIGAEETKATNATIVKLTELVRKRAQDDVHVSQVKLADADSTTILVQHQLNSLLTRLDRIEDREELLAEIDELSIMLENLQ